MSPIRLSDLIGRVWAQKRDAERALEVRMDRRAAALAAKSCDSQTAVALRRVAKGTTTPDELRQTNHAAFELLRRQRGVAQAQIAEEDAGGLGKDWSKPTPWAVVVDFLGKRVGTRLLGRPKLLGDETAPVLAVYAAMVAAGASDRAPAKLSDAIARLDREGATDELLRELWGKCPQACQEMKLPGLVGIGWNATAQKALDYIREHPGMPGDTIAGKIGVSVPHFRRSIVPKLKAVGVDNDRTDGYHYRPSAT